MDADHTVARRTHEYLLTHATWPADWLLHSVFIAWYDYLYTGDASSLKEFYPLLQAKTLTALAGPGSLISTRTGVVTPALKRAVHLDEFFRGRNFGDLVDWPENGFGGPDVSGANDGYVFTTVDTVVNALHYRALVLMVRIAGICGRPADMVGYRERAVRVASAINQRLFDSKRGIYVDGDATEHASQHPNFFPLMVGLVPPERRASVIDYVKRRAMACSVYGAQHLLDALYQHGEAVHVLSLLADRGTRGWTHMIHDLGSTMTLEVWDPFFKPNLDWNHAWGAAPANIIGRRLVGMRPFAPGFGRVVIQPQPGGLRWFHARLPTTRGSVTCEWLGDASGGYPCGWEFRRVSARR